MTPTDRTELRRLAEAASTSQTGIWAEHIECMDAYHHAANPFVVLALLDSIRRADELEAQQSETILHQAGEIARLLADLDALRARLVEVEKDAELGKTAMRFVDRAGDVHPGIDDAETICADFYKAMVATLEKNLSIARGAQA